MAGAHAQEQDVNLPGSTVADDVLQTTKTNTIDDLYPTLCVICLEKVNDVAKSLPCKHDQFHFSCLGTWLQQSRACPLCKAEVESIGYRAGESYNIYYLTKHQSWDLSRTPRSARCPQRRPLIGCGDAGRACNETDQALPFRRRIYDRQLYSLYVGNNPISKYRNITPDIIRNEPTLIMKAKKWIRRELSVFDFLNPDSPAFGRADRRATNAEYLLDYIIAIIKSIDIKGSAGQAVELLKEFLGLENARLFLHELENWLRAPYESLNDWDQNVQYQI